MLFNADDMRAESLAEYAAGCALTIEEAEDDQLELAIIRMTRRMNDWCSDKFESEIGDVFVDSFRTKMLRLPHRTTEVTEVKFALADGTVSDPQDTGSYRLHSSLNVDGDTPVGELDWLEVVDWSTGFVGEPTQPFYFWPTGPRTVQVSGTFGWTIPDPDVLRAVAILVYDHFKPIRADLGRAIRWADGSGLAVDNSPIDDDHPSGIPRVDEIVARLRRNTSIGGN